MKDGAVRTGAWVPSTRGDRVVPLGGRGRDPMAAGPVVAPRPGAPEWLRGGRLCVIANREPYIHEREPGGLRVLTPASGLVTALEPIVRASGGLWIAHGSGSGDREVVDERDIVAVPPADPQYDLKRVWLTPEEEEGYYYGFANEGLWPLCHIVHTRPVFRSSDWEHYRKTNEKFAGAFVAEMAEERPMVLIQDYHFALLPQLIRERKPGAAISLFWHIPWSSPDVTRICPWKDELIQGMLGADVLGFHTQYHCNNFLDCVDRFLEARIDREQFSVTRQGHTCYVRPFPISIEWPPRHDLPGEAVPAIRRRVHEELKLAPGTHLALGVDRVDYTKGILERFRAVDCLLTRHPELAGRFVFVQIGAPSRSRIPQYRALAEEVVRTAEAVNRKFAGAGQAPIRLRLFHHDSAQVFRFYRAADVCVVNSLHDGMNLVAKEFVASRSDEGGALVLSSFTGAARELTDALIVNPYDIEGTAEAMFEGLTADSAALRERMRRMREWVSSHDVYVWGRQIVEDLKRLTGWVPECQSDLLACGAPLV